MVRILAFHAGGPGSIPGVGKFLIMTEFLRSNFKVNLFFQNYLIEINFNLINFAWIHFFLIESACTKPQIKIQVYYTDRVSKDNLQLNLRACFQALLPHK